MSTSTKQIWLTEEETSAILQLPAHFIRKLVLTGSLKGVIGYIIPTAATYAYNKIDIENYIFEDSYFLNI